MTQRDSAATIPLFFGLCLAMFVFSLNQGMLSVALPTILGDLGGVESTMWVAAGYLISATVVLPLYGKLGDRIGLGTMFLIAMGVFLAASATGYFINSMSWLIGVRFVQGLGGGGLMVLSQAIVAAVIAPKERGKYLGVLGAVLVLATVAGPTAGGIITETWGWRWCFAINVPLGVVSLALCLSFLRPSHFAIPRPENPPAFDSLGFFLLALITAGVVFLTEWGAATSAWSSPATWLLVVGIIAGIVFFVIVERRAVDPILPPRLLGQRNFVVPTAIAALLTLATFGLTSYLPTYIQIVEGVDARYAGLVLLPMILAALICTVISGFIVSKTQRYRVVIFGGGAVAAASFVLLGRMTPNAGLGYLVAVLVMAGVGIGFSLQIAVLVVQNSTPVPEMGTVTAANSLFRELGATVGTSLVGALFTARLFDRLAIVAPQVDATHITPERVADLSGRLHDGVVDSYNNALMPVFTVVAGIIAVSVLASLAINEKALKE